MSDVFAEEEMHTAQQQNNKVNSAYYLVDNPDKALDFLLHHTQRLRRRIQSRLLASSVSRDSDDDELDLDMLIPDKVQKMRLMSTALVDISQLIKTHISPPRHKEDEISCLRFHGAGWESTWGSRPPYHGAFDDTTTSSPMQFTHCTPGKFPYYSTVGRALQIYSIKIVDLNPNLDWPLHVYGVVAARDCFDHNRNILFCRSEANCQRVTQDDPFLHLIGPSRAIVAEDRVMFEVELKMKYGAESKDTALFTSSYSHHSNSRYSTIQIYGLCCIAELSLEQLTKAIQATIVGVRVVKGEWPCMYGCRVSCSLSPVAEEAMDSMPMEVVLLESHGEEMPARSDGYIHLSRNVVSVDLDSTLKVCIQAYSDAGSTPLQGHVNFPVQQCKVSKRECSLGKSTVVEIIVAWSLLPMDELG